MKTDILGAKFNRLTVIGIEIDKPYHCLCQCDCGSLITVSNSNLRKGNTKSCGCLKKQIRSDLTGKTFGRLTVLGVVDSPYWKCLCECGNTLTVRRNLLTQGRTKSCGCLRKETSNGKKKRQTKTGVKVKTSTKLIPPRRWVG